MRRRERLVRSLRAIGLGGQQDMGHETLEEAWPTCLVRKGRGGRGLGGQKDMGLGDRETLEEA